MPNDYVKKEPTKTEKLLYELVIAHNQMEKGLWSTSSVVMALGILTKTDPTEVAKLLVDDTKLKEYSEKVNAEMKKLQPEQEKHNHD